MDTPPPLLGNDDLPGPMCLNLLASSGALCKLDSANAYSCHDSDTLYGRSCIIATLLPSRSVACSRTAAWVWLGGTFPESIDIIAKAHYRALRYGRKINVFNRLAPNEHTIKVGPIIVTTPVRTACDLALNCTPKANRWFPKSSACSCRNFISAPTIACKSCRRRSIFATRHRRATTFLRSTEEATNMSAAHSRHKARRATHADRIGADRANGFRRLLGIQEKRRPRTHRATHRDARNLAHRAQRTRREPPPYQPKPRPKPLVDPPSPPIPLTPLVACSPDTPQDVLWHIAEYAPQLRKWLVANPSATPAMLDYLAQVGGPDVARALQILLESLESCGSQACS